MVDLQTEALIAIAVIGIALVSFGLAYVSALRWSYFDPLGKPAAFPSSFSDLSMWIARVEGSGDAPLFAGEYAFSKREKKTSREAVGASADDDAMTSIGCGGAYPKRPPRKPACEYEME